MIFAKFNQPSNATKFWWRALPQKKSAHFHDMPSLYGVIAPTLFFVHMPITAIIISFELYATLLMHDNGIPLGMIVGVLALEFVIAFGISILSSYIRDYNNKIWYREKWVSDGKNWIDWVNKGKIRSDEENLAEKINEINKTNLDIQGFGRNRMLCKLGQFVLFLVLGFFFYFKLDNYIAHFGLDFTDLDFRLIFTGYVVGLLGHTISTGKVLSFIVGIGFDFANSNSNALRNAPPSMPHRIEITSSTPLNECSVDGHQIYLKNAEYQFQKNGFMNDVEADELIAVQEDSKRIIVATFMKKFQLD